MKRAVLFYTVVVTLFFAVNCGTTHLMAWADGWNYFIPYRTFLVQQLMAGRFPWWNPYQGTGLPAFACLEVGPLYPPNWLFLVGPMTLMYNVVLAVQYILTAMFARQYAVRIGLSDLGALAAGLLWMGSGFMVGHMASLVIFGSAVWLPLVFCLVEELLARPRLWPAWGLGAALALQFLAGHHQELVETLMVLAVYVPMRLSRPGPVAAWLLVAGLVSALLAAPLLVASYQQSKLTLRSTGALEMYDWWPLPPSMYPLLVAPFAFGGGYGVPWWGRWDMNELTPFIGVLGLAAAAVGLGCGWKDRPVVRAWGLVAVLGLALASGPHTPWHGLAAWIQRVTRARCPGRHAMEVDFALAMLAGAGLDRVLTRRQAVPWLGGLVLAIGLVLGGLVMWGPQAYADMAARRLGPSPGGAPISVGSAAWAVPLSFVLAWLGWTACVYWRPALGNRLLLPLLLAEMASFACFYPPRPLPRLSDMPPTPAVQAWLHEHLGDDRCFYLSHAGWPLSSIPQHIRALNSYDPLMAVEFRTMFGLPLDTTQGVDWRDNLLLSVAGVKYIVAADASERVDSMQVAGPVGPWRTVPLPNLPPPDAPDSIPLHAMAGGALVLETQVAVKAGQLYSLSLEACSRQPDRPLEVVLTPAQGDSWQVEPWLLSSDYQVFYRTFVPTLDGQYRIQIHSESGDPIEVRHIHLSTGDTAPSGLSDTTPGPIYRNVAAMDGCTFYENRNVLPPCWSPTAVSVVPSLGALRLALGQYQVDPRQTALVLPQDAARLHPPYVPAVVQSYRSDDTRTEVSVNCPDRALLVVSQEFDMNWQAQVDGHTTPIVAVDGIARAIELPAGHHQVVYSYEPTAARSGFWLSALALLVGLVAWLKDRTDRRQNDPGWT